MSEAIEVQPWCPDMGPPPRVRIYSPSHPPRLLVYTLSDWRLASVMARHDWPDRTIGLQLTIRLPVPELSSRDETFCRTYRWDARVMLVLSTGDPPVGIPRGGDLSRTPPRATSTRQPPAPHHAGGGAG
ncbi:hypothetical protein [Streptomyces phytophilus]|uniref:hypothetical protein n=1 Tax=Streptomyces phytophilus TaxID=722715 RepID=UPI0015F0DDFD|nr:hypothetical protein [Streptomyces phytophilus]